MKITLHSPLDLIDFQHKADFAHTDSLVKSKYWAHFDLNAGYA